VITGIVVAFSATALAVALLVRLNKETGQVIITSDDPEESGKQGALP
jgi:multicomponent Na+:H+ antiporter subunit C